MNDDQRYEFELWWERMGLRGAVKVDRVYEDYRLWARIYGAATEAAFKRELRARGVRIGSVSRLVFLPSADEWPWAAR